MKIACAVLAAGGSTRMGQPKQLLPIDGEPLIARLLRAIPFADAAVVLGANAQQIAAAIPNAHVLHNPRWAEGMSTSLHTAVYWAQRANAAALMLCTCDQPLLTREHLERLAATATTAASRYDGALGVPALLEAKHFERLLQIEGDRGAASLLRSGIPITAIDWPEGAVDLDTPEDLQRFNSRA